MTSRPISVDLTFAAQPCADGRLGFSVALAEFVSRCPGIYLYHFSQDPRHLSRRDMTFLVPDHRHLSRRDMINGPAGENFAPRALRAVRKYFFGQNIRRNLGSIVRFIRIPIKLAKTCEKICLGDDPENCQNEGVCRHPHSYPGAEAFISKYILTPQIFRHLSRFIFDMAPPDFQAFIEKNIATNSARATARKPRVASAPAS